MTEEHFDVLIVGAGLSGVAAGCHLQMRCPDRTYAVLEARNAIGGTWDLFRYPGIRSDSDMYTLGYAFRPWKQAQAIADGPSILQYIRETAREYGVDRRIRFDHRVVRASWSTREAQWTVEVRRGASNEVVRYTCSFLLMCSGYYDYAQGYAPQFPGAERFAGRIVHPQTWPDDVEYENKRVVVIGSGATAVTLVPELAKAAAHVTMLQRSPTYIASLPREDRIANVLRAVLPVRAAYWLTRWKNVLFGMLVYKLCKARPALARKLILHGVRRRLGPGFDVDAHFQPRYNPWDQRLCLAPNGDLFEAIRAGRASVVTDQIEHFTPDGIQLRSGGRLEADLVVTATGLNLVVLGGVQIVVDGREVDLSRTLSYKGMMYSDVPNLASAIGYTNASWTLKCDLTCEYVCRLLNHMRKLGVRQCTARRTDPGVTEQPWIDFSSGYVLRSIDKFPKQGSQAPWRLHQNYARDILMLRFGAVEDEAMEFSNPAPANPAPQGRRGSTAESAGA